MNENLKSVIFVAAALVVTAVAWAVHRSTLPTDELAEFRNQPLFPDFTDPLRATSLEIIKYDENKGEAKPFQVAQVKGRWCIPSHSEYPADAKDHMVQAATSVMGLVALDVVSRDRRDHPLFGVVDPGESIEPGAKGVGTRVVLKDKDGQTLIGLVIGKEAGTSRDSDDQKDLRYVRKIGEDPVYLVKLNPDKLSTDFGDWIEKDLLKLNAWDIKTVAIQDYSFDIRPTPDGLIEPRMDQRAVIRLEHNDTGDPRWKLVEAVLVQDGKPTRPQLAPDEELNTRKLDDLKYAVDDLKIVDVAKKPPVLSGSLRATGKMKLDPNSVLSLADRGFYLVQTEQGMELFSSEGEIRVTTKDGVQYVLRFGRIASAETHAPAKKDQTKKDESKTEGAGKDEKSKEEGKKDETKKPEETKDSSTTASVNRYLFVMAQFDPSVIEKPKLEPLPPEPKPEPAKESPSQEAKKDEGTKPEPKKEETKPAEAKKEEGEKKDQTKPDPKAERQRIEKENKQKTDEYNKKIEEGKKKVEELNARFADWYYVISDEVYQKIHLGYKDIVQKKEKKEEEAKKEQASSSGEPKPPAGSPAEPPSKPEAKPEPKPEAKPEAKAESKPEAKPESKLEAKPEAKPEPKPQPNPEAKAESKPEAKAELKPEAKAEPKPEAKPEPKPEPKPEAKPDPKPEAKAEAKSEAKADPKPEAKAEAKPEAKAEPKSEAKPAPTGEPAATAPPAKPGGQSASPPQAKAGQP